MPSAKWPEFRRRGPRDLIAEGEPIARVVRTGVFGRPLPLTAPIATSWVDRAARSVLIARSGVCDAADRVDVRPESDFTGNSFRRWRPRP